MRPAPEHRRERGQNEIPAPSAGAGKEAGKAGREDPPGFSIPRRRPHGAHRSELRARCIRQRHVRRGSRRLRLPVQGGSHRRHQRRQVEPADALHAQRVQPRVEEHHRRRVRDEDGQDRGQVDQGPDLGHGRPGALPRHHVCVLSRRGGRPPRVRHLEAPDLRERRALAARVARARGAEQWYVVSATVASHAPPPGSPPAPLPRPRPSPAARQSAAMDAGRPANAPRPAAPAPRPNPCGRQWSCSSETRAISTTCGP